LTQLTYSICEKVEVILAQFTIVFIARKTVITASLACISRDKFVRFTV